MTGIDLRIERLSHENFEAFTRFMNGMDSGCYCSFWHQKWSSMEEWDERKAKAPEKNRVCMSGKLDSGFHLGVLAFSGLELVAWVSIGPMPEFYWAWRRMTHAGDSARTTAIIPCITRDPDWCERLSEADLLKALIPYARTQGWTAIEGYPFDRSTLDRLGDAVTWPGTPEAFTEAGFERTGEHWLNNPEYARSIHRLELK